MKMTWKLNFASNLMLAALLAAATGCQTSNYESGNATAGVLRTSAGKLETARGRVDSTLAALNDLVNNPANLPVHAASTRTRSRGCNRPPGTWPPRSRTCAPRARHTFQAWDQQAAQIQNADIRARSMARKKEVLDRFTKVKLSYTQVSDAYHPFMSDLKDIQTALGTDLTAGGIAAIKDSAHKANQDAIPLKKAGDDMSDDLKDLSAAMYSSVPAPAAPAPALASASTPAPAPAPARAK